MLKPTYSAAARCYRYNSPAGVLYLSADRSVLTLCDWVPQPGAIVCALSDSSVPAVINNAVKQLHEYFDGKRSAFDLPMCQEGSDFARKVWDALAGIQFGEVVSYAMVAERIGKARSIRAVASAIGRNRLNIFIGCHRVLPAAALPYSPGKEVGDYRGGKAAKQYLCDLEYTFK